MANSWETWVAGGILAPNPRAGNILSLNKLKKDFNFKICSFESPNHDLYNYAHYEAIPYYFTILSTYKCSKRRKTVNVGIYRDLFEFKCRSCKKNNLMDRIHLAYNAIKMFIYNNTTYES